MLQFFGKGSAFSDDNTCAYFVHQQDMVIIDFSQAAFPKFRRLDFSAIQTIYILVTHTHGDHISGIGTLIHYAYHVLHLPVIVAAPTPKMIECLKVLFDKIEGCHPCAYTVIYTDQLHKDWFIAAIPTEHTDTHAGNCFGYGLWEDNVLTVYTGDTNTLKNFITFLTNMPASRKRLYTEISYYNKKVHLHINDHLPELLRCQQQGVEVFLMHLDNEALIREAIKGTSLRIVDTI